MVVLYEWLKEYCGSETPEVQKLEELFTFHAFEIEGATPVGDQTLIDVKVLPDRASDCLSHRGIARELATLIGTPLTCDPLTKPITCTPILDTLTLTIADANVCRRFSAARIEGVTVTESPQWLQERLHALGQRSINNVVDATNYVMLAIGQPLHAYDVAKLIEHDGGLHLGVRMAEEGEEITTLTGDTYTLTPRIPLIVDMHTNTPLSIAGIKGGKHAEIGATTTSLIIEAANFDPQTTRRASQALRLQTDASKRFENNIVPELTMYGIQEVVTLILQIAGGTVVGYADTFPSPHSNPLVRVTTTQINTLLGMTLSDDVIENIFTRLGFSFVSNNEGWDVSAPFERTDIRIPADVIAEVGRVHGYKHVALVVPETVPLTEYNPRFYYSERIRQALKETGLSEVITSSFRKSDVVCLQNALATDKGCLRSSLRQNVREALDRNIPNVDILRLRDIMLFEIGTVFTKKETEKGIQEHTALAVGVRTKQTGPCPKDDVRLTEIISALEQTVGFSLNAHIEQGVAECNLSEVVATLPTPQTYVAVSERLERMFEPFSLYPFISRDIALWVPEGVTSGSVHALIQEKGSTLLLHATLFDEFHKDGKISYAFRLVFQSNERTLTDEEVGNIMRTITSTLLEKGYTVR